MDRGHIRNTPCLRIFSCAPSECNCWGRSCRTSCILPRPLASMELLHMQPEVGIPVAGDGAELALVDRFVSVDSPVGLQAVALGEPGMADVTLVRLLRRSLTSGVPLCVSSGVCSAWIVLLRPRQSQGSGDFSCMCLYLMCRISSPNVVSMVLQYLHLRGFVSV